MLIVGESSSIEFVSNDEETRRAADSGCLYVSLFLTLNDYLRLLRYLLALRNKKSGTISILPSAKSPYVLTHTVKALKAIPSLPAPTKVEYLEAKTALGETFGTKKQKANIRAQARNKIDPSAMQGVMDYVMDSIDKGVENLPTLGPCLFLFKTFRIIESLQRRVKNLPTKVGLFPPSLPVPWILRTCTLFTI